MSNPNFVSDLVAMAKAFEELPQVKAYLEQAHSDIETYAHSLAERETSILKLKAELEASHEARRKVEAERDDAELRFLESEDRTASALSFIKTTFGSAGSLIQALEPPAPVSIPTPPAEPEVIFEEPINLPGGLNPSWDEPVPTDATMGQSEPRPTDTVSTTTTSPSETASSVATSTDHVATSSSAQAEEAPAVPTADPTVLVGSSETGQSVTSTGAPSIENASVNTTNNTSIVGPYTDKLYINHPIFVHLSDWLAGGGTEANYYYRH